MKKVARIPCSVGGFDLTSGWFRPISARLRRDLARRLGRTGGSLVAGARARAGSGHTGVRRPERGARHPGHDAAHGMGVSHVEAAAHAVAMTAALVVVTVRAQEAAERVAAARIRSRWGGGRSPWVGRSLWGCRSHFGSHSAFGSPSPWPQPSVGSSHRVHAETAAHSHSAWGGRSPRGGHSPCGSHSPKGDRSPWRGLSPWGGHGFEHVFGFHVPEFVRLRPNSDRSDRSLALSEPSSGLALEDVRSYPRGRFVLRSWAPEHDRDSPTLACGDFWVSSFSPWGRSIVGPPGSCQGCAARAFRKLVRNGF